MASLMRGEISAEDIPSTANRAGIAEIYAAKREYEAFAGALKEFNTKRALLSAHRLTTYWRAQAG